MVTAYEGWWSEVSSCKSSVSSGSNEEGAESIVAFSFVSRLWSYVVRLDASSCMFVVVFIACGDVDSSSDSSRNSA